MASFNKVILVGNLTRNVELKSVAGGTSVCELGLAVNEKFKKKDEWVTETVFVDVVCWGKTAELCSEHLSKGSAVLIDGRLKLDVWKDRTSGKDMQKLRVVCEKVQFLDGKPSGGGNRNQQSNSSNDRGRDNDEPPVF